VRGACSNARPYRHPRLCNALADVPGFAGTGFMAYEVVSDLRWTSVLNDAHDVLAWANPGPGCARGLNWVHRRDSSPSRDRMIAEMRRLLAEAPERTGLLNLEMREIEHSLCEFDKYMRTVKGQGRPRSTFTPPHQRS